MRTIPFFVSSSNFVSIDNAIYGAALMMLPTGSNFFVRRERERESSAMST